MVGSFGPKKLVWLGDFDPQTKEWVKVNKRLETDTGITEEECVQRNFIWLEGRCFAIKSYRIRHLTYGTHDIMNEMDDVFTLRQYYAMLK